MTAIAYERPGVEFDPIRDKTYRRAALGPDVAAFLADSNRWKASEHKEHVNAPQRRLLRALKAFNDPPTFTPGIPANRGFS